MSDTHKKELTLNFFFRKGKNLLIKRAEEWTFRHCNPKETSVV